MTEQKQLRAEEVNARILAKLDEYPPTVRELATEAIRLSESLPEQTVAEQLQPLVRKLARRQYGDAA